MHLERTQRDETFGEREIRDDDIDLGIESVEAPKSYSPGRLSLKDVFSGHLPKSPIPDLQGLSSPESSYTSPYFSTSRQNTPIAVTPPVEQHQPNARTSSEVVVVSQDRLQKLPIVLEYVSLFAHLATFGIIGVLVRYGLEELFGPKIVGLTQNTSALFSSLPDNMVGSFFMGWVGIVFKKEITRFSEHLAIGLSTGLMGSITTFASWNQKLLNAITAGYWVRGLFGFLIGMELAQMSLQVGIDSAKVLQFGVNKIQNSRVAKGLRRIPKPVADNLRRRQLSLVLFLLASGVLWVLASTLVAENAHSFERRKLWLACVLGPPGVWTRWFLSRYNGQGIGRKQWLKWLPIGTLATNIIASMIECLLSLADLKVHNYGSSLAVGALQLGFLGCMSTVSTLVSEVYLLHQQEKWWRAYVYTILTICLALITGIILYSIFVWVNDYKVV